MKTTKAKPKGVIMKEVKAQIREIKREMKGRGIRRISCFNGGLTPDERYYNSKLFELETAKSKLNQ